MDDFHLEDLEQEEYERYLRQRKAVRTRNIEPVKAARSGKRRTLASVCVAIVVLVSVALLFVFVVLPFFRDLFGGFGENRNVIGVHEYFLLDPNVPELILDGERLTDRRRNNPDNPPLVEYRGGVPRVYLPISFLRRHIDPFIFWDEGAGVLFVSTPYEMLEFTPGNELFVVNGLTREFETPIRQIDGEIFMPISLVHGLYNLLVEYQDEYNMVVITSLDVVQTTARVSGSRVNVRYFASRHAPIAVQLPQGSELVVFTGAVTYEWEQEVDRDFVRVRTSDGLLGYIPMSDLEGMRTDYAECTLRRHMILDNFVENNRHYDRIWQGNNDINLIWDYVHNLGANAARTNTELHPSVNVVSPTWFRIDECSTQLTSFASRDYITWAHNQGVEVWPKVFDVNHSRVRPFLMNRDARQTAVRQITEAVDAFGFDGLNVDFEHLMRADEGPYKLQFLRELAIPMRERGITLSAAVIIPIPTNFFYRRDLIAKTMCFVMVMAYDQYWQTSPEAGPNAALWWVRAAVENMLSDGPVEAAVPPERLVLGVPFYSRVWRETVGTGEVSHHSAWNVNQTRAFIEYHGGTWTWCFETGSYRGEASAFFEGETVIFRTWLECARSMREKMHLFVDNNLGGIGIWMRHFEQEEFWLVIDNFF